jgi:hypothetical protein
MSNTPNSPKKILLSGVFGPFGVDDEFGRKENIMELFHNQVTREQGEASFRSHHRSFGLYFLAENLDGDITVLDFPSRKAFEAELRKGYDIVGLSFIAPNFKKAQAMAAAVRRLSPSSQIVLGGHGTAIEGIEKLIDHDHIIRGEGIRPFRRLLGQNADAPIVHPILPSTEQSYVFGLPIPGDSGNLLVPGVGCVNGCAFCCTTHFFGKQSVNFFSSGKELFETACRIADARGSEEFFVMDENFLKDRTRAMEFLGEMERTGRYFDELHIFSSAEAILAFGLDNMVRLGVSFVWVGVESSSPTGNYEKNAGIDATQLVNDLRDRGILVLASGILCQEHHTPANIQRDIDFMVGLNADFVQFMLLSPMPTTTLFKRHQELGLLREDLPFEEWHGQKELCYRHPAFPGDAPAVTLKGAFRKDFEVNSSSAYRVIETTWRGYQRLLNLPVRDSLLNFRLLKIGSRLRRWSPMLAVVASHAVNDLERTRALELRAKIDAALGGSLKSRAIGLAARAIAAAWVLRLRVLGDGLQPKQIRTHYPATVRRVQAAVLTMPCHRKPAAQCPQAAVAMVTGESC